MESIEEVQQDDDKLGDGKDDGQVTDMCFALQVKERRGWLTLSNTINHNR